VFDHSVFFFFFLSRVSRGAGGRSLLPTVFFFKSQVSGLHFPPQLFGNIMEVLLGILARTDVMMGVAYTAILIMALVPIWVGSHRSLNQKAVMQGQKNTKLKKDEYTVETLSSKDAYMFPVIGSGVLFGLYLLFKYFSKEYVNLLLTLYFLFFGVFAVSASIRPYVLWFFSSRKEDKPTHELTLNIPFRKEPVRLKWSGIDILSIAVGLAIGLWYVFTKHWISNNILGLSFSVQGVAFLSLGSYQIGCILLGGLFLYDIFWVFGTDVMVTVAKSFDAPIKLLWPKNFFANPLEFSMLGLGDIVIPGIFIALMLRFDAQRARGRRGFKKPYFTFTFSAYILGMITTIAVMHIFQAAQPALLYLVPFCIGASLSAGALLGELKELVFYTEEKKKTKNENKKKGKGNTKTQKKKAKKSGKH